MPKVETKGAIEIFDFSTPHDYLRAVLDNGSRASLRAFARWSGIKSPATLSLILRGKRGISPEVEEKLINQLRLTGQRKRYLSALCALSRTRSHEGQHTLNEELFYIKHLAQAKLLEVKQYEFLSRWYYCAIFVMVGLADFRLDYALISKRLGRYVTPSQVREAIETMQALGLIEKQGETLRQVVGSVLRTPEEMRHLSVRQFHRRMIQMATLALEIPQERREITSLTVAMPLSKLEEVKARIRLFREELDQFLDRSQAEAEEVYQLNVQFFPLTVKVIGEKGESDEVINS